MNDFRKSLYDNYVSRFKKNSAVIGARSSRLIKYQNINFIKPILGHPKDSKVLDIGCGSGQLLESLQDAGYKDISGIDLSAEQVASAQDRNLPVKCIDVFQHLNSSEDNYDIIYAIDLIEHFSREEIVRLGKLLHDSLNDGGLLVLQTPNGKSPYALRNIYGDMTHLCIFSDESVVQWLENSGFTDMMTQSAKPVATNWEDRLRIACRSLILSLTKLIVFIVTKRKESTLGENLIAVAQRRK